MTACDHLLRYGGTCTLDADHPVKTLSPAEPAQADFELALSPPALPVRYAVRARGQDRTGPMSDTVQVFAPPALPSPLVL